jgi:hypothetical protein
MNYYYTSANGVLIVLCNSKIVRIGILKFIILIKLSSMLVKVLEVPYLGRSYTTITVEVNMIKELDII